MKQNCNYFFTFGSFFWSLLFYSITVSDFTQILPHFSRQNWRVILEVLLNLYFTARSLVWENEWNNWEMFTCSLRSHNFKSGNISGKIRHCECIMHIDTVHGELNQSIVCAVPPEWIVKPQDQEAVEGQDVFFDCRVSGVPEPSIIWRRLAGMTTTLKLFN